MGKKERKREEKEKKCENFAQKSAENVAPLLLANDNRGRPILAPEVRGFWNGLSRREKLERLRAVARTLACAFGRYRPTFGQM